jgi:hypothetical protein
MLHARWHEIKQSTSPPTGRPALQELLQTALALDGDFQAWEATIPVAWRYETEPNNPQTRMKYDEKWQNLILDCRGAPPEIHSYPNLKSVWIWGFYRTSRIFLLRDILEIINWIFRLPDIQMPVNVKQELDSASIKQEESTTARLDNMALCIYRSLATDHLVEIIEKTCSAILGSFTVPVYAKSFDDVAGMRGYVCLWALGTMDAVLGSGLVPDSIMPDTTTPMDNYSEHMSVSSEAQFETPEIVTTPPRDSPESEDKPDSYAAAPQFSELSKLSPKTESGQRHHSSPTLVPEASSSNTPSITPSVARKGHIFDSSPARPFDQPVELPSLNATGTEPQKIDVAARREWLNRMLYYIGKELGIKKALYVPLTEGYMPKVKPAVDSILGL